MIRGVVTILGRPNVGKSTLFNCLTKTMQSLVNDQPGVTRDRIYGTCYLDSEESEGTTVVDTGGFETKGYLFQPFAENIVWKQTEIAIDEADLVLFVLDGKEGVHPLDRELLRYLVKQKKPFLAVVNKTDGRDEDIVASEFYELGLDKFSFITASHNQGIEELREEISEKLDALRVKKSRENKKHEVSLAIIGKPNVGKSSLLNRLAGEERSLVSDVAGTTRDTVDIKITHKGKVIRVIDTAGARRKSKIKDKIESLSVLRSIQAIEECDVAFLVIDALDGLTDQDARLAEIAVSQFKPLLIVVNKWDLFPDKKPNTAKEYTEALHHELKTFAFAPVEFVSCLTNQRVHGLLDYAVELQEMAHKRVKTSLLNGSLKEIIDAHTPTLIKTTGKRVKFYFATQVRVGPPTFVVFTNVADEIKESYKRYMKIQFQKRLGFENVPIRVLYRGKNQENNP